MLKEFRDFLLRGNIVELAVAFVLGVAFAVSVVMLHRGTRPAERDLDVVVPHQELAAADRVALGLDAHRPEVAMLVRTRVPLLALDPLEGADLLHAARRMEVVEDRLVPGEALEAHDLLGQERAVLTELDVALARHAAEALIGRHVGKNTRA